MRLAKPGLPLREHHNASPLPGPGQIRVAVRACAVCRTDLHVVDGELKDGKLPVIPGHEIIGHVEAIGAGVHQFQIGDRVGIPWLGWSCGTCRYCLSGEENLCPSARFTGYQIDGGFASETIADARYAFSVPDAYSDEAAAPLMCAGLIGWRCLNAAGKADRIGLFGFGAAAHIVAQVARARGQEIYAFVRPGDEAARAFALGLGAAWAGGSDEAAPCALDATIIFAPAGTLVPAALKAVRPGGTVVCGGIHMSDIPSFPYALLWQERRLRSVANLTRSDAKAFLDFAASHEIHMTTTRYPLGKANQALDDLRNGRFSGAAVLIP